ncbi:YcxB family protein [Actinoplanes sp. NPDC023801]|uniref:YcxB family protein n=1 Tax=Actinoplanes sp. NPDC023801 TaxID=3154595 RepID=UPI0033DF205F
MHIEFTHARTPEYFRRRFAAGAQRAAAPYTTIAAVLGFAAVIVILGGEATPTSLLIGVPLLVAAALLIAVAWWRWKREVTVRDGWLSPRTWRLTNESFRSSTDETTVEAAWSEFRSFLVQDDAYILHLSTGKVYDIPREPLTPEQDAELVAFFRTGPATP